MTPGLLLSLIKAGAGIVAPQKPEHYDMEKKPENTPHAQDVAAWAFYAGILESVLVRLAEKHGEQLSDAVVETLRQNPLRRQRVVP